MLGDRATGPALEILEVVPEPAESDPEITVDRLEGLDLAGERVDPRAGGPDRLGLRDVIGADDGDIGEDEEDDQAGEALGYDRAAPVLRYQRAARAIE